MRKRNAALLALDAAVLALDAGMAAGMYLRQHGLTAKDAAREAREKYRDWKKNRPIDVEILDEREAEEE